MRSIYAAKGRRRAWCRCRSWARRWGTSTRRRTPRTPICSSITSPDGRPRPVRSPPTLERVAIFEPDDVRVPGGVGQRVPVAHVERALIDHEPRADLEAHDVGAAGVEVGQILRRLIAVHDVPADQFHDRSDARPAGLVEGEARADP